MTDFAAAFAHFPDDPYGAIHSQDVRPVFESLPADQQEQATRAVLKYDPRDGRTSQILSADLGVAQSVAIGLSILLHPDA
jgi:hypothetical protein